MVSCPVRFVVEKPLLCRILEPGRSIAQETVGMEPSRSQEVDGERIEVGGVCSTDEGVGALLESHESAVARVEHPRCNPSGGLECGETPDAATCYIFK